MLLQGKSVVVTGGSRGIGQAIAIEAAAQGANVVVDYHTHPDDAERIVEQIKAGGQKALAVSADVSKPEDLKKLVETAVREFGQLDVLVNNAGVETRSGILKTTEDEYDSVLATNLKSAFFGTQYAARQFIEQGNGGVVINVSSIHEDAPMPDNIAYCVAKGGMRMLTRTAGVELGAQGIRVVNVSPGAVATPINQETLDDPALKKKLEDSIPLGRVARPEEIAKTVVFLASDAAGYITATSVFVDGGIMQAGSDL